MAMDPSLVIAQVGAHQRAYPTGNDPIRVRTHLGDGALVYTTDDGYIGVRLDGEARVDEYLAEWVTRPDGARLLEAA